MTLAKRCKGANMNTNKTHETAQKKRLLRQECKRRVKMLTAEYTKSASTIICERLLNLPEYKTAKTIFCFVGTESEIDTSLFIQQVLNDKKILCVPLCEQASTALDNSSAPNTITAQNKVTAQNKCENHGKVTGIMHAKQIASTTELRTGFYGILEPSNSAKTISPSSIDLAILPCLAAEKTGARLGFGGGFYDRYLPQLNPTCKKVMICREKLILPTGTIPIEPHDVFADVIITEL